VLRAGEGLYLRCMDSEVEAEAGENDIWLDSWEVGLAARLEFGVMGPLRRLVGVLVMLAEIRMLSPEDNILAVCRASLTAALTCGILSSRQLSRACSPEKKRKMSLIITKEIVSYYLACLAMHIKCWQTHQAAQSRSVEL
jgi:hypothetical protein